MAAEVAAVGAAGAAVAAGTFGYNRENFLFDAENRWERFSSAREYANQQAEQYRADIRALAALTVKKSTVWCIMSSLTMALCVALYCAGRLGLHGPSPPAWIMGLWLTNNAAAFAFMALCMFLAMHAGFRAQAASTQLLTRTARVPVPTLKQLDNARWFASEFEQQAYSDIFRVPFVTHNGAPRTDDGSGRSQSAPPRGYSSWMEKEFKVDRAGAASDENKLPLPADMAPEHFRLFTAVQKEYYEYDIYARVCIFYGFIHYVQSLAYYGLGHINIELRAFWVAYGTAFVIAALQALLLRFDIIPQNTGKGHKLQYCQFLGPLAILPAAVGMSMDFQVQYDPNAIAICWVLIFVAYIMQLIYSLRMFEIVLPDEVFAGAKERLGASWMPEGWRKVPSSFYHVFYFVAPPEKLRHGQHDLVQEIKDGGAGAYDQVLGFEETDGTRAPDPIEGPMFPNSKHVEPWRLTARIVGVLPAAWVFLIGGCVVDVILGEQALVTAPHWSRPPMTRLSREGHELGTPLGGPHPAGDQAFTPEQMAWHEEKRHAGEYSIGRRLGTERRVDKAALASALENLVTALSAADKVAAVQVSSEHISWPGFFEPKVIACGSDGVQDMVVALTPRGFGAVAPVGIGGGAVAKSFKLSGLSNLPPLLGVSWGLQEGEGLLAVSRGGHLVSCPGQQPEAAGAWACRSDLPQLPLAEGTQLKSATAAWLPTSGGGRRLHAAIVVDSAPDLVGLFSHEAGSWLPLGEMRVPGASRSHGAKTSLSFVDGDIIVATDDHVLRQNLQDGRVVSSVANMWSSGSSASKAWQASCGLPGQVGKLAHLHLQRAPASKAWRPEVVAAMVPKVSAA